MTRTQKHIFRLAVVGLLVSALGGCAVVPYGPPGYYAYPDRGYPDRGYAPVVPVPVPFFEPWHGGHHHHRW